MMNKNISSVLPGCYSSNSNSRTEVSEVNITQNNSTLRDIKSYAPFMSQAHKEFTGTRIHRDTPLILYPLP